MNNFLVYVLPIILGIAVFIAPFIYLNGPINHTERTRNVVLNAMIGLAPWLLFVAFYVLSWFLIYYVDGIILDKVGSLFLFIGTNLAVVFIGGLIQTLVECISSEQKMLNYLIFEVEKVNPNFMLEKELKRAVFVKFDKIRYLNKDNPDYLIQRARLLREAKLIVRGK